MNKKLRELQLDVLRIFSKKTVSFALAGGTALELFYLKHRFSRDLDFFSMDFNYGEIVSIIAEIRKAGYQPKYKDEIKHPGKMKVLFYTLFLKGSTEPLKLDFVEDVLPQLSRQSFIKKIEGIPVYDVRRIYFQKLITVTGIDPGLDELGEEKPTGRKEARDVIDIYYLSKKIEPLSSFLKTVPRSYQRTMVGWYRNLSLRDFEREYLDYAGAVYDRKLKPQMIVRHLNDEIEAFMKGELS